MSCMKCGRDIAEGQVFCPECLAEMEKYPVKPETAIFLPQRKAVSPVKKAYAKFRQGPTPEEQIRSLRLWLRSLFLLLVVTLILLGLLAYPMIKELVERERLLPGQNYTAITSTETNETN